MPKARKNIAANTAAGTQNGATTLAPRKSSNDQSYEKYKPSEIKMPNRPPSTPRSRTWNQCALTLTIETAPNDWKYMLRAFSTFNDSNMSGAPSVPRDANTTAMPVLHTAEPPSAIKMVARPPQRSVSGPLSRKAKPYTNKPMASISLNSRRESTPALSNSPAMPDRL